MNSDLIERAQTVAREACDGRGVDCTCLGNPRCRGVVCECGHPALDHHGIDGRERRDAGCQTRTMREDWCRCALTATQVTERGRRHG